MYKHFWIIILILIAAGCSRGKSGTLINADSIIEEHPDSALAMLEGYCLEKNSSDYDKALYGMLITYARYKNGVDEDNDSVINLSSEYFLEHGHKHEAIRSLFMQGTIRLLDSNYGGAAESFSTGMDLANEEKDFFWKGKCARGLFLICQKLMNGSGQVRYALEECDAFSQSGHEDWLIVAKHDLAIAHNNNGLHDKAALEADSLIKTAEQLNDTLLLTESRHLLATALFANGKRKESIAAYRDLARLAPDYLNENDMANISLASSEIDKLMLPTDIVEFIDSCQLAKNQSFEVLAHEGNYKEAYKALERYRMEQDSVLSIILKNTVSESIARYKEGRELLQKNRNRAERLTWMLAIVILVFTSSIIFLLFKNKIEKERSKREEVIKDAESLKADLLRQANNIGTLSASLAEALRKRHAVIDSMCSAYYEESRNKTKVDRVKAEISDIINKFSNDIPIKDLEDSADRCSDRIISSFKKDFPDASERELRLFIYIVIGFSTRTISLLFDEKIENIYNRKSRLKKKIIASASPIVSEYLTFL